ncbi:insulinoma-associated protein 1-like [Onthophagus taurus]|uniref:insulinoma-associated protein 1-like n=1 Tax=Onthophagus taurus TaxID=166361 RepID=UPI000C20320E|nr:insulinoma-associated protein 1-like [Onthophagus taurus]
MPRALYHHEMELAYRPYHYQPSVLQRLGFEQPLLSATAVLQHHLQYLRYSEPLELSPCPLDLSLKSSAQITPPCTPSPGNTKRNSSPVPDQQQQPSKKLKPTPIVTTTKKSKANRKLNFDEDNTSPVSGTIIRELRPDETLVVRKGDIDPAFNVVEVTEEAKAELAKIENHIGDYVCRLCKELYEDAFGLAQHRCSRIVHVEYKCPECDKVFNCPANLASHRRWHKPRPPKETKSEECSETDSEQFPCNECGKKFRRVAYLRKHQATHQAD